MAKNEKNVLYLAHRHPAKTRFQDSGPGIAIHLNHKGEPLTPVYAVGMDCFPVREAHLITRIHTGTEQILIVQI